MKWLLDHLQSLMPGVLRVKDGHGFALGHTATLPTCEARRRGEKRRVQGGAGVLDREVVCRKTAADAYGWWDELLGLTILTGSTTWNPAAVANGNTTSTTFTLTGAADGDVCVGGFSGVGGEAGNGLQVGCTADGANTVRVWVQNQTGGSRDLPSGTARCSCLKY